MYKKRAVHVFLIMSLLMLFLGHEKGIAQEHALESDFEGWGTRSWIRLDWKTDSSFDRQMLYWATKDQKPDHPQRTFKGSQNQYYVKEVTPETEYYFWLEQYQRDSLKSVKKVAVKTKTRWALQERELNELVTNPSSSAVPHGMVLTWQDEFNDSLLNRNKWSTNYYSSIDALSEDYEAAMKADNLPQPAYILNGRTINLYVSDSLPKRAYFKNGKKISSIQTYDWREDENLLDNSGGGYFEVRVKRSNTGEPEGLNTAFWFDAPGPDIRNYLQRGSTRNGVRGIRPKGQLFEIDVFEYITAQFVVHGDVDQKGNFVHNLETHIAEGYEHFNRWVTHGVYWSPAEIKHYINGNLIKRYDNKEEMHSPNHFMNVLLGSYGKGGTVNMEVDYIRFYQWPLEAGNELPNPGFEMGASMAPWEGTGEIVETSGINHSRAVSLAPSQWIEQTLYLDNDVDYNLYFKTRGEGALYVQLDNLELVTGKPSLISKQQTPSSLTYELYKIPFRTGQEYKNYKKKVRIQFKNRGEKPLFLDQVFIYPRK